MERVIKNYGQSLTDAISIALKAPVGQGDKEAIQQILDDLAQDHTILTVEVFEEDGELLAQYPEALVLSELQKKPPYQSAYTRYGKHPRLFVKSIVEKQQRIGFISVRVDISRLDKIHKKLAHRTLIAGLLCLLILLIGIHFYLKKQLAKMKFS